MRNILKLGLFLCIVAGIAGLSISYVNGITYPIIQEQIEKEKLASFQEVYPGTGEVKDESNTYLGGNSDSILTEVNVVYQENNPVGVIYMAEPVGYSGVIQLLVGMDIAKKEITAIKVLSQTETPGLGTNAQKSFFTDRYKGKSAESVLEVVTKEPVGDNQILAITSATITSKAVTEGVNAARQHFLDNFIE
ncbi:MAG: FMN-binding protein [Clostridia bacterium]|jgi:electron transport complex protein RnfG|nr:FMN-binding protein [Clostridia bacterium]